MNVSAGCFPCPFSGIWEMEAAQAHGDFDVLAERGRRLLRVHLGPDTERGLGNLRDLVAHALK